MVLITLYVLLHRRIEMTLLLIRIVEKQKTEAGLESSAQEISHQGGYL
jgi:hypothetical protein